MKYTSYKVEERKTKGGIVYRGRLRYKDDSGKWRWVSKTLDKGIGKREANRLTRAWQDEMNKQAEENSNLTAQADKEALTRTVKDAVQSYLDEQLNSGALCKGTHYNQVRYAENRIYPIIGNVPFAELTPQQITKWLSVLYTDLQPSTVTIIFGILQKTYNNAVLTRQVKFNPCDYVQKPTSRSPKQNALTKSGRRKFEVAINEHWKDGNPNKTAILLEYYTGMRTAEVCGLRWRNISFTFNQIEVATNIGRYKSRGYEKGVKNASSRRLIPMSPQIKKLLETRLECVKADNDGNFDESWFICGDKGKFLEPYCVYNNFRHFVRRYDIRGEENVYITPHQLRHTFATVGVSSRMDIKTLSSILGHANAAMTLNTYASSDERAKYDAMQKLGELFQKESEEDI